jgi:hypothetical protein
VGNDSAKHSPQQCGGLNHPLDDELVVQIFPKTNKQQSQEDKNYRAMAQGFSVKCHKKKHDAKKQKQGILRG